MSPLSHSVLRVQPDFFLPSVFARWFGLPFETRGTLPMPGTYFVAPAVRKLLPGFQVGFRRSPESCSFSRYSSDFCDILQDFLLQYTPPGWGMIEKEV